MLKSCLQVTHFMFHIVNWFMALSAVPLPAAHLLLSALRQFAAPAYGSRGGRSMTLLSVEEGV
jgi:hypothetical protein